MKKIWLSPPHMSGGEMEFVKEAFDSNWIAPLGPHVDAFENEICNYLNIDYAAAVSSGTAALHLALILLDVKSGDEVICQSFTFSASANPIVYQQAIPIFIDSEEDSWNMDPNLLEKAIKERIQKGKKPKAIIGVHLYGQSFKVDDILSICNYYDIPLIEDAAEALGSEYKNIKLGTFGKFGILSFNGNKIITTSGGGILTSKNKDYIEKAKFLSTQARDEAPHYEHSHIGYNYRMSNVLAGIGRGQLKVIEDRVNTKRRISDYYKQQLGQFPGIEFQPELINTKSNKWLTAIIIDPKKSNTNREKIRNSLLNRNIDSRPLWKPMHLQPVFKDAPSYANGVSEKLFTDGLCLPSGTNLNKHDLDRICKIVKKEF